MNARAVVLEKPEHLVLADLALSRQGDADVTVRVAHSGISTGTEKLLWLGRMPPFPGMGYPLVPGYESVGEIVSAGRDSGRGVGEFVFVPGASCFGAVRGLFGGASSRLVVAGSRVVAVPRALGEHAVLLALAATAYHAVDPQRGCFPELVVGHGVLGRLITRIVMALGAPAPVVWETNAARREGRFDYSVVAPADDVRADYGCVCDVSGDVGFIDLSKIASQQRKPTVESRRLRSSDDVAPDVRPTQGGVKKGGIVRGDRGGARDTMTASQLRDREAGRFLRRNMIGGGPGGRGYGGGGGGRTRRGEGLQSPMSGKELEIEGPVTLKKLADALSVKFQELVKVGLQNLGLAPGQLSINALLDEDTAVLMAQEYNVDLKVSHGIAAETALIEGIKKKRTGVDAEQLISRPPTVAFMGHVDHGKTTLIDAIRSSRVASGESGGITQHIGAYQVATKKGHKLTIIDTPGHAAFTAMRARGANAVDIVVLVVAADDGPMPSTEEALAHARAAKVPLVVALTKVDKADANLQKAKENLTKLQLVPEEWGGDTAMIAVSALKGTGVEELLERVFLESEVLQLKSHPRGPAKGIVLEAEINEGKGIVAHLLVQDGTLKRGDVILAGEGYGKVRAMFDDRARAVDEAPPSMPIEVTGLSALPSIGEAFYVVESLAQAKEVATEREKKNRALQLSQERRQTVTAESLMRAVAEKQRKAINVVVRADVQGSVEVLKNALSELKHDEVEVKVLFAGVGQVTENDVNLAGPAGGIVIAFHVGTNDKARTASDRLGVEVRYYEVIYELLDHIRLLMEGVLAPEMAEEVLGHAEIRVLFKSSKVGLIAGSHVLDGMLVRDCKVRVLRDGKVVHTGQLGSLRREKDDAKEVRAGFDCGITIKDWQDVREGDQVEAYKVFTVKRTLGSAAVS